MKKNKEEIYTQFYKEYPELLGKTVASVSIHLVTMLIKRLEREDKNIFDRCVLIEKVGNLYGRKIKVDEIV